MGRKKIAPSVDNLRTIILELRKVTRKQGEKKIFRWFKNRNLLNGSLWGPVPSSVNITLKPLIIR